MPKKLAHSLVAPVVGLLLLIESVKRYPMNNRSLHNHTSQGKSNNSGCLSCAWNNLGQNVRRGVVGASSASTVGDNGQEPGARGGKRTSTPLQIKELMARAPRGTLVGKAPGFRNTGLLCFAYLLACRMVRRLCGQKQFVGVLGMVVPDVGLCWW